NAVTLVDTDKLQAPHVVVLNRPRKIMSSRSAADYSYMANVQGTVFCDFHQQQAVRNQEYVVDNQREGDNKPVRGFRVYKGNRRGHDQTGQTYRLRQPGDLFPRRQRRFGIDPEHNEQNCPSWNNDCKNPQVYSERHDCMAFELEPGVENLFDQLRR